jgi:hypothetical protein
MQNIISKRPPSNAHPKAFPRAPSAPFLPVPPSAFASHRRHHRPLASPLSSPRRERRPRRRRDPSASVAKVSPSLPFPRGRPPRAISFPFHGPKSARRFLVFFPCDCFPLFCFPFYGPTPRQEVFPAIAFLCAEIKRRSFLFFSFPSGACGS